MSDFDLTKKEESTLVLIDEAFDAAIAAQETFKGLVRDVKVAKAISIVKKALTPEVMEPIMELQGKAFGFRTDKDLRGGYTMQETRDCLIDAKMQGLEVTGNQFNIIAGRAYATKEGMQAKLSKLPGLESYCITHGIPVPHDQKNAAIESTIEWVFNGNKETRRVQFTVGVTTSKTGQILFDHDNIRGKADKKARAWLFQKLTGVEVKEADVDSEKIITPDVDIETADITKKLEDGLKAKEAKASEASKTKAPEAFDLVSSSELETILEGVTSLGIELEDFRTYLKLAFKIESFEAIKKEWVDMIREWVKQNRVK